ncbi:hypothetical protein [Pontibacter cellulosilyticus]|uniref:Uncharacterized protein n=1 Tax=Pontibacter cellulosilyticus TaxID=1720253 RepID=A0A923N8F5_9BACT|nr:hypothetical protein [Pontibacter cellulosilyticus]MBC5993316.1 hypothetical protein [Pontibacter cellulosilyticus]
MNEKNQILQLCKEAHALSEQCYLEHSATKGSSEWFDKRKFLLADVSLHMVQAALQNERADVELIRRYLFSLLTICDEFIPEANLSSTANKLIERTDSIAEK